MGVLICSTLTSKFQKFREINREVIHDHESANIIFVILAGKKRIESATDFSFFFWQNIAGISNFLSTHAAKAVLNKAEILQ